MILHIYTIIHTLISLIAILTGVIVLFGMLAGKRLDRWTKWFLTTAVLTTVTGFFFPFHGFTPAIGLGIISLPFLALTIFARYPKHLAGAWRWVYAIGAVLCLYFNLFVLIVQLFEKVPSLHAIRSDADRAAIQAHAAPCSGVFRSAWHRRDNQISPRTGSGRLIGSWCTCALAFAATGCDVRRNGLKICRRLRRCA